MDIDLNQRDTDRLYAVARYRGMTIEECAVGLIQQSLQKWEAEIRHRNLPAVKLLPY